MKLIPRGSGSWQEVTRALGYDKRHSAINYNRSTQPSQGARTPKKTQLFQALRYV